MRKLLLLVALGGLIAFPAPAAAQAPLPEGDSGIHQYQESVPGAGGDHPTDGRGTRKGGPALSGGALSSLEAQGPIGTAVADLAEATAPDSTRDARSTRGEGDDATSVTAAGGESGSGVINLLEALLGGVGDEGMGIALPIIVGGGLLGALLLLLARRRRGGE